jgi:5'-3' exonuclease
MTVEKIFYLLEIDKKSQICILLDLLIKFKINFVGLTPEELRMLKALVEDQFENVPRDEWKALLKKLGSLGVGTSQEASADNGDKK